MAGLEDLGGPGHADGHGWAEAEANEEQAGVAGPGRRGGREGRGEQAGDLDEDGGGEEEATVVVEAVREGCDEDDGEEVHLRMFDCLRHGCGQGWEDWGGVTYYPDRSE